MPQLLSPGVFIQEIPSGQSIVTAVSTSTMGSVGFTKLGPVNVPQFITSLNGFFTTLGGYVANTYLPLMATAFFANGGSQAWYNRVVPSDAVAATASIAGYWKYDAFAPGVDYNRVNIVLAGDANTEDVATATFTKFNVSVQLASAVGETDYTTVETYNGIVLDDPSDSNYFPTVLNNNSLYAKVTAVGAGPGGIPTVFDSLAVTGETVGTGDGTTVVYNDTLAQPTVAANTLQILVNGTPVAKDNGTGKIVPIVGSVSGTVSYSTGALHVVFGVAPAGAAAITADYYKAGAQVIETLLAGGADGTLPLTRADLTSPALAATGEGLYAFDKIPDFLNLGIGESAGDAVMSGDLISYAENRKDCFVVLAGPAGQAPAEVLNYKKSVLASQSNYAAMYYPWVTISDPLTSQPRNVPPIGHVLGVYARTDNARNVSKAPAGVNDGQLSFAIGLERVLSPGERDLIYPSNINPLISSPQTGRVVWGARTLALTGDFTLVQVRRLFIFLEKSVFNSTHDFVFENMGDPLFASITARITGFMLSLFQQNYFKGNTPKDAFFVTCNASNNPTATQNQRIVFCDIGVAANEPAEFVVFRFQRKLASA